MKNNLLKGERYTVSETMEQYPPLDTMKPFRMPKELKDAEKVNEPKPEEPCGDTSE